MSKVYDFLEANNMLASSCNKDEEEQAYLADMQSRDSLCMFNTYISSVNDNWPDEKILAVDAGGTNLRFAEIYKGVILSEKKIPMYGVSEEITADEFFDLLAPQIEAYECEKVGFCFSYPAELLPDNDAKIVEFEKEVKISGAEGRIIGKEINKRLKKQKRFYILNDTVACSLGAKADMGLILGTGFNICYFDKASGFIINSETGGFSHFKPGRFDYLLNEKLNSPKVRLEKLISGAYIGKLMRLTAEAYFQKELPEFDLEDISRFLLGEGELCSFLSIAEQSEFKEIINTVLDRAAAKIAMCVKCFSLGSSRISIGIEGSTIYKLPGYYEKVTGAIRQIPGAQFEFIDARNTISIGSARACFSSRMHEG